MALTRRAFLPLAACSVCGAVSTPSPLAAQSERKFHGCGISPQAFRRFNEDNQPAFQSVAQGLFSRNHHFRTTGDRALDKDLDRALGVVADLFQVYPAFGFYDPKKFRQTEDNPDSWLMNAWASEESTNIPGTWGTVGFGWDLFHSEYFGFDSSGTSIMAIVAHEFAHTWQQKTGNIRALRTGRPLKSEINADFLAGYYLGTRKHANPSLRFAKAGDLFVRLGKHMDGDPNRSHGASQERLDAAEAGFRVAYVEKKNLDYATKAGLEYVGL